MTEVLRTSSLAFMDRIYYPDSEVKKGEVVFLLGPSGSGKSTLLRLLNGTVSPSGGRVFYNGRDILEYNPLQVRREVILAGQAAYLFPGTVRENFHQYHEFRESSLPDDESIKECLEVCRAPFGPDDSCNNLSGGEKQRVFLAVALSFRPNVFLLDEPTSALDRPTAEGLMKNISEYCRGRGIASVIVSHDRHLVDMYADRTIDVGGESR
ncbi:MAG: ABC transporter ATP-binding protein [Aminivibrio sp.]|jgi:putative ABC transport system ATP-binding protein|nr:energy-coupling factor ABC transporter ATP-binding protein [Synergistaceae bacterium]